MVAPRSRPCSESPAWKMTGCPCGGARDVKRPRYREVRPAMVQRVLLRGIQERTRPAVPRERVLLVGVPQPLCHPHELKTPGVARVVVVVLLAAEVARRAGVAAGHDVPPGSA